MSTTIVERKLNSSFDYTNDSSQNYSFNTFYNGTEKSKCVQLTLDWNADHVQFNKEQLKQFIEDAKIALDNL